MALLVGFTVLTVMLGDRVGVTLERMSPQGVARSTASVVIQFSETMNRESVEKRLRVEQIQGDAVQGVISWNGSIMSFRPATALKPGAAYQVTLSAGAVSESGRDLLTDQNYTFMVRSPRVAYLAPSDRVPRNIWIVDPADLSSARQVTESPSGVEDFAVSPDGSKIAFSESNSVTGTKDIKVLDLDSGGIEQVTNCQDAECKTPVWRPDGQVIAYERVDYNSDLKQGKASPTRIWLIDLTTKPATTRPMFADSQTLGYGMDWSADGQRATLFDIGSLGILVYDFRDATTEIIPSKFGNPGVISPDGTRMVFPEVVFEENQTRSYLQMADLTTKIIAPLTDPADPINDETAHWSPDSSYLVVARQYLDERYTPGKQLYRLDPNTKAVEPLLVDPAYNHGFFSFDPTGAALVIQRFSELADTDPDKPLLPEIWTFDIASKTLTKVADNALLGRWVP